MDSMTETPSKTVSWQQHINIWKNSGLSGPKFCHANNLIYHQFSYWRKKLDITQGKPLSPSSMSAGFVQVSYAATETESLQLILPNGVEVTGINTTNVSVVRQLLSFL